MSKYVGGSPQFVIVPNVTAVVGMYTVTFLWRLDMKCLDLVINGQSVIATNV